MIQTFHILRKDIRHLWADLSLYVALLIAYSIVTPMIWYGAPARDFSIAIFAKLLSILIPILWLVIIARLIHDESLVGDQQFWITRPYKWISLLSAKLLFIVLCVVLPFALMQWALLLQAGLNPLRVIAGQSQDLLMIGLVLLLPFIVVAAVTSTVQRMVMSMLAALMFWGIVLTFLSNSLGPRMSLPGAFDTLGVVMGVLLIGILLYQYARRNTLQSRIALASATVLLMGLFIGLVEQGIPGLSNLLIRHHYPAAAATSLHLVFDPAARSPNPSKVPSFRSGHLVEVDLPIYIEGLAPSVQLNDQNVSFTLDAPGITYTSPWRRVGIGKNGRAPTFFLFPQNILDQVHASKVHMHLSVVAQSLVPGTPQTITAADHFLIPWGGMCKLLPDRSTNNLLCSLSFGGAEPALINGLVTNGPCGSAGPMHPAVASLGPRGPGIWFDPIISRPIGINGAVCPGTQLTLTTYHPAENFRIDLDIPSISLDEYLPH